MANEITVAASLAFSKSSSNDLLNFAAATFTLTGSKYMHARQAIGNSEEAIVLGEVTGGGGWFLGVNRDSTNSIHIRQATGAANFCTLGPGECCLFRWSTTSTAPFAISSASTPELEYLILVA